MGEGHCEGMTMAWTLDQLPPAMRAQAASQLGMHVPRQMARQVKARAKLVDAMYGAGALVRRNKYNAKRIDTPDGTFDSMKEFKSWRALRVREAAGEIEGLRHHVRFSLFDAGGHCRGEHIGTYEADFVYRERGKLVVADAKGHRTREWKRTKKLMRACHGHDVREL